ncbi:MAG: hypothetical protein FXF47_03605 [Candidatus Mcinerneyibacterium aminivorans]|uniref:Uncharacterized protein n=1 Tax=Candidatus Mcinerneyibacterium aminivorans TaxID=2703815 RepID=A0A5D0MIF6_9BACT|nr:MAG: hypothetical protein FXF47_03605 [Candidatus Mcinerneyibacterium aminivorans]
MHKMIRFFILSFVIFFFFFLTRGSVDYEYSIRNNISKIEITHNFIDDQLYINKMNEDKQSAIIKIKPLTDANYFNIKIYHVNFIDTKYKLYLKKTSGMWSYIDGIYNNYGFQSFKNFNIDEFLNNKFIMIKIEIDSYFIGIIQKIECRYFEEYFKNKITINNEYEGVNLESNIITAKGFAILKNYNNPEEKIKQQRAATIRAYRNLAALIRKIANNEKINLEENRLSGFVRGAKIIRKEYKDDGIYVTIGIQINGENGLNNIVKH